MSMTINKISTNILIVIVMGTLTTVPAQANSLTNIPFDENLEQTKSLDRDATLDSQRLKLSPSLQSILDKNSQPKNQLHHRLLEKAQTNIDQAKQASTVTQTTIAGKNVYLYDLESTKPKGASNFQVESGAYLSRWKFNQSKPRRKVSEPGTSMALVGVFGWLGLKKRFLTCK